MSIGDRLSDYATFVENGNTDFLAGSSISGILADGTVLDIPYSIFNMGTREGMADIIIIPEPTSILFFSLGALTLLRKRKP